MGAAELRTSRFSVRTLACVVFILVSSGPYGVEEMVSSSGPGIALILILLIPVVWGWPLGLVCAELASAIPVEGGAYAWIDRGLGRFWAFQSGWWSTLSLTIDTTVYVVLAVAYANSWLGQPPFVRWLMAVGVIALFAVLNVRSLSSMARASVAFSVVILLPCVVLAALGVAGWERNPFVPLAAPGQSTIGSLGLGLTIAIWFYSGFESLSAMAGEIESPQRVIPRALLISLPLVVAVYFLPTAAGLASVGRWSEWGSESGLSLVQVAAELGGPVLATMMMAGALVSSLALYNSYLASSARTTLVMGQAGLLPRVFARIHPRFGTPHAAIIIAAVAHALLAIHSFETLLVIDVFLFVLNYLLVFITCVILRVREPDLPRPFRIPVGTAGLIAVAAVPVVVGLLALVANGRETLIFGSLLAATGPLAYVLVRPLGRR